MFCKKENIQMPKVLPTHVGFIMDGNGRWAIKRGLSRMFGHKAGVKQFEKLVRYCKNIELKNISFYAFSTENWKRPYNEVNAIMDLLSEYIDEARNFFCENTRIIFLGNKSAFDKNLQEKMIKLEEETAQYKEMTLMLAVNYGGRDEIANAVRILAQKAVNGEINPYDINEQSIASKLYTNGIPDVDLIIRTGGELRLSNYLIWQCAYAEYYFTDVLWPDFTSAEFNKALIEFSNRQRRFGGV